MARWNDSQGSCSPPSSARTAPAQRSASSAATRFMVLIVLPLPSMLLFLIAFLTLVDAHIVDEFADQPLQDDRGLGETDVLAVLYELRIASELQLHIAIAKDSRGHDRRRRVHGNLQVRSQVELDARPIALVEGDGLHLPDLHTRNHHRRPRLH